MDTARVEAIATAVSKPEIALTYHDGSREISFDKASEGQRAAALLFMLLEQPGGPLIIDQPEGDLDNRIITDLTDQLHKAKQNRQLVFASHNANIVVNGSSELVGHLDVKDDGERHIHAQAQLMRPPSAKLSRQRWREAKSLQRSAGQVRLLATPYVGSNRGLATTET